jgi:hypothetical protein
MQSVEFDTGLPNLLRFVFADEIISLSLPTDATFGDIADSFGDLAPGRHGAPKGIVVTLPPPASAG